MLTDAQRHLEYDVANEIEAVLRRHDLAGVVLLASREAAAWRYVIPTWSVLERHAGGFRMHIRFRATDPDITARSEDTLHMVGSFRDMACDVTELFARIFRVASEEVARAGNKIVHKPFGGGDKRPDPYGGKVE